MGGWLKGLRHKALAALVATFAAALVVASPVAIAKEPPAYDATAFDAAVETVKGGDLTVDFRWLREQNAARLGYQSPNWKEGNQAFAFIETKPDKALALANKRLAVDFLDIHAHIAAEAALKKLSRENDARQHHAVLLEILRSITEGKSGETKDEAWNASFVHEEYMTLFAMGFEPVNQSLSSDDGHFYDVMTVKDVDSGQETKIWFNIDSFFNRAYKN